MRCPFLALIWPLPAGPQVVVARTGKISVCCHENKVSYLDIAEVTMIVGGPELDLPPEVAAAVADMDDPWK